MNIGRDESRPRDRIFLIADSRRENPDREDTRSRGERRRISHSVVPLLRPRELRFNNLISEAMERVGCMKSIFGVYLAAAGLGPKCIALSR